MACGAAFRAWPPAGQRLEIKAGGKSQTGLALRSGRAAHGSVQAELGSAPKVAPCLAPRQPRNASAGTPSPNPHRQKAVSPGQVWRRLTSISLSFREQIQGPENAPIARFFGLRCYQSRRQIASGLAPRRGRAAHGSVQAELGSAPKVAPCLAPRAYEQKLNRLPVLLLQRRRASSRTPALERNRPNAVAETPTPKSRQSGAGLAALVSISALFSRANKRP